MDEWVLALIGGICVGAGAVLLLITAGKISGVSSIASGLFSIKHHEWLWKFIFIFGLLCSAIVWVIVWPDRFNLEYESYWVRMLMGGFMVGYGAKLANGCTSGHGVCGVARFSKRSITATATFLASAVLTVLLVRLLNAA